MAMSGCSSSSSGNGQSGQSLTPTATVRQQPTVIPTSPPVQSAVTTLLNHATAANQKVKVQVPQSMRTGVFAQDRYLNVPSGFAISVYARIPGTRFMAMAPNGDMLVSVPGDGKVVLVHPQANGDPRVSDYVTGLSKPHDIVFHAIGQTTYVYISETNQVDRFVYHTGDTQAQGRQIIVSGLPDSSLPELHGQYGHELKNIALDDQHHLYVSVASTCNACVEDTISNPVRGAIYQYDENGKNGHLYARGLRNAEGLAFVPGTNTLWVAVNNRDNIAYPFQDSTGNYGQVVPSYVDNHPPDEFTQVRSGGNYGWPFCNPDPAHGMNTMPFDRDVQFNADGHVNCDAMDRINKGIQAHSAPLGLSFISDASMMHMGALIGLHGSWNRTQLTGYKVIFFPWNTVTNVPGNQVDLVTGWIEAGNQQAWGRPVDSIADAQGNVFISDDQSGTIYKLSLSNIH
jgi:glucose/arabinose dehydrogenase